MRASAADCTNCDLYRDATQTVFGDGPIDADLMLIGEQPGDKEDLAGEPFVGPAGRILDEGLRAAGIERSRAYVTNAVKHFKWKRSGKVRLHQKPNTAEIRACRPWLDAELDLVDPRLIVLLGATASQALFGPSFRVTREHGQIKMFGDYEAIATVHPSSILRARDEATRIASFDGFVEDLRVAALRLG